MLFGGTEGQIGLFVQQELEFELVDGIKESNLCANHWANQTRGRFKQTLTQ